MNGFDLAALGPAVAEIPFNDARALLLLGVLIALAALLHGLQLERDRLWTVLAIAAAALFSFWADLFGSTPMLWLLPIPMAVVWTVAWLERKRGRMQAVAAWLVASGLMGSVLAFASTDAGGPDGMIRWLQDAFGWSLHTAEVATVVFRKCVHFSYYGLIGWTAFRGAIGFQAPLRRAVWFALLWTLTYAAFDEISQLASASRTGSILDVLLDLAGASAFMFFSARRLVVRNAFSPQPNTIPMRKNR